jgi:hypothetical protein
MTVDLPRWAIGRRASSSVMIYPAILAPGVEPVLAPGN